MFLLWLYWQERINLPFQRKRNKEKMHEAGYTEDIEQAVPEPE
jgi:hypothetical protein